MRRRSDSIALGGFMGSGKTTVGRLLSGMVELPFLDTDELLSARFGPPADQIARDGEPAFRRRERALVEELVRATPWVLATGGGLWVDPDNRRRLRRVAATVVLSAPLDELRVRLEGQTSDRPLWGRAAALFEARREAYADADRVVETAGKSPAQVAEEIVAWWRS